MGQYSKAGSYSGYKKNNKEREALDYYSTPTKEVVNILNTTGIDLTFSTILEPCAGGGHMLRGIEQYIREKAMPASIIATDVKARKGVDMQAELDISSGESYDFLSDAYPYTKNIDYVIMNPPFSTIEPFTMKALEIANKGVLLLGRLQFLEAQGRYKNIFSINPPTDVYVYIDRIVCYKNGDTTLPPGGVQAYAWYYFDKEKPKSHNTLLHWIHRV